MVDVYVVIVNYNVRDLLRACLRSVFDSIGASFKVCVVDNASTDGSVEMVAAEFPQVDLIASSVNTGFTGGNNLGLRRTPADARYVLLLNPDTVVPPDAFANMVAYCDDRPKVGVAGCKLVREDGSLDLACRRSFPTPSVSFYRMTGLSKLFPKSRRFGRYNLTYLDEDLEAEVDAVVGAFMFVRRTAMDAIGLLDETFFMYGEDIDWAKRFKDAGWQVRYYPAVEVLHYKGRSSRQAAFRAGAAFYRSMWIFYRKHYATEYAAPVTWIIYSAIHLYWGVFATLNRVRPANQRRVS